MRVHDEPPGELLAAVDAGLDAFNVAAAPLHEVRPLACAAHAGDGALVGGAVGRSWGGCAELQQLWVDPAWRRRGLGTALLRAFHERAEARGCRCVFLETFGFQAPALYEVLGYHRLHELAVYPHGIVRWLMIRPRRRSPGAR
ncbi:MAG: GNAT family N-acetyltransferase [Burkholderiales bacterium]|nr:GNAT family N-acetyltransferase [Burkholderiales bacterium]